MHLSCKACFGLGISFLILLMFGGFIYHGSSGKVSKHNSYLAMSSSRLNA